MATPSSSHMVIAIVFCKASVGRSLYVAIGCCMQLNFEICAPAVSDLSCPMRCPKDWVSPVVLVAVCSVFAFARTDARSFATTLGAAPCDCCFAIDAQCECIVVCCKWHVLAAEVVHWFATVVHVLLCL